MGLTPGNVGRWVNNQSSVQETTSGSLSKEVSVRKTTHPFISPVLSAQFVPGDTIDEMNVEISSLEHFKD